MFITIKRHEREKQELTDSGNRLKDAILKNSPQGLFILDAKDRILPQVSKSLGVMFGREDFTNLSFEKLVGPLVSAKSLTIVRNCIGVLLGTLPRENLPPEEDAKTNPLAALEVQLKSSSDSSETAIYCFDFDPIDSIHEARAWLVRVTDITVRVQETRELAELRTQLRAQGEVLSGVLQMGRASLGAFLRKTAASMKTINAVLKKPAREEDAFRQKLQETLDEVDCIRREAAAFKLSAIESAARVFEDALHELRSRSTLSGGDFLPLAMKLDRLHDQFAQLNSLTQSVSERKPTAHAARMTSDGTQVIQAPTFSVGTLGVSGVAGAHRTARAGSLESTLSVLTEHVALEHNKSVVLECVGLNAVPPDYQNVIKNVAIQLIRNAVMHGIEEPATRKAASKRPHGTLRLEFRCLKDDSCELLFEDDGCGLDPDQVRNTAILRGVVTSEAATRLRDREAIKLIFKSGYTTIATSPTDKTHGAGMSLVRRYIHEAAGKIALASLLGHETRFKITLPSLTTEAAPAQAAAG